MWSTVIPGHYFPHLIEFYLLPLYFQYSGILWSVTDDNSQFEETKTPKKQKISLCFTYEIIMSMSDRDVQYSLCICKSFSFIIKDL